MNWDRVYRSRVLGRILLAIAGLAIMVPAVVLIAAPMFTEPTFGPMPPIWPTVVSFGIGIGGITFGLVWMWRIYKAPTKSEGAHWRFRDHD